MEFSTIRYEKENHIAIITLNRPKRMNAIDSIFIREFRQIFDEIKDDDEVGAVIITGSEKVFAAGADIKEIGGISTPAEAHEFFVKVQSLFNEIENLEKPVIAAVNGLALGGGCELTLVCDIRIAAENSRFGLPEIKLGVLSGAGGTQRLPRLIGVGRAKEMLYSGDPIDAQEAYRVGLVNKVAPVESLLDEAKKMATEFMKRPTYALKMIKACVNNGFSMDLQSALAYEARCFEFLFSTEDQKEGMKAFMEKRKPVFKNR